MRLKKLLSYVLCVAMMASLIVSNPGVVYAGDEMTTQSITSKNTPIQFEVISDTEIISQAEKGVVVFNAEEERLTYTPNEGYVGSDAFAIRMAYMDDASIIIHYNIEVYDQPILLETDYKTAVNFSFSENYLGAFEIAENGKAENGSVEIEGKMVTYSPKDGFSGRDHFTIITRIDQTVIDFQFEVTVKERANVAPELNDEVLILSADQIMHLTMFGTDADGDELNIIRTLSSQNAVVYTALDTLPEEYQNLPQLGPMDIFYIPNADFVGRDEFTVTITDGFGGEATASVIADVYPAGVRVVEEDHSLIFAELPEGLGAIADNGVVHVGDPGEYMYTPNPNYNGPDKITFTRIQENKMKAPGETLVVGDDEIVELINIIVLPVNDAPEVDDVNTTVRVGESVEITINVTDVDEDDSHTLEVQNPEEMRGTVEFTDDYTMIYTPNDDFTEGTDIFYVRITDEAGEFVDARIEVEVVPVDTIYPYMDEDSEFTMDVEEGLEIVFVEGPSHGEVKIENGLATYRPTANYNGKDTCLLEVYSKGILVYILQVKMTIYPMDDAPEAIDDNVNVRRDRVLTGNVLDNDIFVDGDEELNQFHEMNGESSSSSSYDDDFDYSPVLRAELVEGEGPAHGTVILNGDGSFTYDPDDSFQGTDTFKYNAFVGMPYQDYVYDEENENEGTMVVRYERRPESEDQATVTITVSDLPDPTPNPTPDPTPDPDPDPDPTPSTPTETLDDDPTPEGIVDFNDGYITGYPDGSFKPTQAVTRIEMVTILARILKLDINAAPAHSYPDVSADHWGTKYLNALDEIGLVEGYKDGSFRPDKKISRAEIATLISRYWDYVGFEADASEVELNDVANHWAEQAINELHNFGLIEGFPDKSYKPDSALLREQLVSIVNNLTNRDKQEDGEPTFNDVNKEDNWSYGDIEAAAIREEE